MVRLQLLNKPAIREIPMTAQNQIRIGRRTLKVSNLDKVLYPKAGFTKGDVIDYYVRISSLLLPHLKDRALTMKRFPNGVDAEFFYAKRCPDFRPAWVKTASIWSKTNNENIPFCLVNDLPSLVWVANLADLELHTSLARCQKPKIPTTMVFDLDPGQGANIVDCAQVAIWLRDALKELKLKCFPKTSGSKGLQVYVPLNTATTYDETKTFSHALAGVIAEQHPDRVVTSMAKRLREGKVFIDWSQNDFHKTTVCCYSLRANVRPSASTPLLWKEIVDTLKSGAPGELSFEQDEVLKRAERMGDAFAPVLTLKQKLPKQDRNA
jgi:bifunctional non-homologous end joining protein LigD